MYATVGVSVLVIAVLSVNVSTLPVAESDVTVGFVATPAITKSVTVAALLVIVSESVTSMVVVDVVAAETKVGNVVSRSFVTV